MSYQNVGVPRFYIDYLSYWKSLGIINEITLPNNPEGEINGVPIGLTPSKISTFNGVANENTSSIDIAIPLESHIGRRVFNGLETNGYVALLGHDLGKALPLIVGGNDINSKVRIDFHNTDITEGSTKIGSFDASHISDSPIINALEPELGGSTKIEDSGFTIYKAKPQEIGALNSDPSDGGKSNLIYFMLQNFNSEGELFTAYELPMINWTLNNISMGHFYDMVNSPELELTMDIDYSGYDSIMTLGGANITNVKYFGNPQWAGFNPWEINNLVDESSNYAEGIDLKKVPNNLDEDTIPIKRNGRRSWSLSFSFISDKDIFSSNYSSNDYLNTMTSNSDLESNSDLTTSGNKFEYTLADDDSFMARVFNFIGNGQRFIFQPDRDNSNPDQFAICVLDQKNIEIEQVAPNVYSIALDIREVW